jgi:hypothetical protein
MQLILAIQISFCPWPHKFSLKYSPQTMEDPQFPHPALPPPLGEWQARFGSAENRPDSSPM